MGNEIFEEIKKKYKKSNKYMLCVSYEDIGILIQIIEKQTKEIEELKTEKAKRSWVHIKEVEPLFYVSEDKIKAKIEEIDKKLEYETNGWESEYEYCKEVLQSLLNEEE